MKWLRALKIRAKRRMHVFTVHNVWSMLTVFLIACVVVITTMTNHPVVGMDIVIVIFVAYNLLNLFLLRKMRDYWQRMALDWITVRNSLEDLNRRIRAYQARERILRRMKQRRS